MRYMLGQTNNTYMENRKPVTAVPTHQRIAGDQTSPADVPDHLNLDIRPLISVAAVSFWFPLRLAPSWSKLPCKLEGE